MVGYPTVRRDGAVVDDLHGYQVPDPYRWLEDPDSEETQQFAAAQNTCYERETASFEPLRQKVQASLTKYFDFPKFSAYRREGGRLHSTANTGLQNQDVMYVQDDDGKCASGEPRILLDPNTLSEDGTVAVSGRAFSRDGEIMSYALSASGSDWQTLHFLRVADGQKLDDVLEKVKFSSQAWYGSEGIFYHRYLEQAGDGSETKSNQDQKMYFHKIGTSQQSDVLVWEMPEEPTWMSGALVTPDDKFLLNFVRVGCEPHTRVWAVNLGATTIQDVRGSWVKVINEWCGKFEYVANDGEDFVFLTTNSAPLKRVVRIPSFLQGSAGDPSAWSTIIAEGDAVLADASAVGGGLLLIEHLRDVKSTLALHRLATGEKLHDIDLPVGTVLSTSTKREYRDVFIKFTSLCLPGIIYRIPDVSALTSLETIRSTTITGLDLNDFETKQVFFPSDDGTKIPMFIVHRKGLVLDGTNPTILYGYGGFNISLAPTFSVSRLMWAYHFGGIYAIANIRGGGEYGQNWHDAGRLKNKQNCYVDFQAAAKFLSAEKFTCPSKLAIQGGSNGGLLVCVCANQAPELFGAVVSQVGVLDIHRFHLFTIGHAWKSDFGDPTVKEDFEVLTKYSAQHNIKEQKYPAMLLLTADHDDRVVPLHSFKFIAEAQHKAGRFENQNPLLIKVDTKAGHGAGKPTAKIIEEGAHVYAFIAGSLGAAWRD